MRNELESKLEINTSILWDEPEVSKEVKVYLLARWSRDIL